MGRYTAAQVGGGARGKVHLDGWLQNPDRFDLVALCELDRAKMAAAAAWQHPTRRRQVTSGTAG